MKQCKRCEAVIVLQFSYHNTVDEWVRMPGHRVWDFWLYATINSRAERHIYCVFLFPLLPLRRSLWSNVLPHKYFTEAYLESKSDGDNFHSLLSKIYAVSEGHIYFVFMYFCVCPLSMNLLQQTNASHTQRSIIGNEILHDTHKTKNLQQKSNRREKKPAENE